MQIWCKKVQTKVKRPKRWSISYLFTNFTTPCKPLWKCGIYYLCLWFPPRLHFFAPCLPRANLRKSNFSWSEENINHKAWFEPIHTALLMQCSYWSLNPKRWDQGNFMWLSIFTVKSKIVAYLIFLRYNPQPDPHGLCNHFMSKRENLRLIKSFA